MQIIGHRGARGMWPENTLAGFARAIDAGVKAFELDVNITADGVIVVHHDFEINPEIARRDGVYVTKAKPTIRDCEYKDICDLDVGQIQPDSKYAKRFPDQCSIDGQRIPLLADVLALACDQAQVTIEVKSTHGRANRWFVAELKQIIDNTPPWQDIIVSSFDWQIIEYVHELIPGLPTAALSDESNSNALLQRVKALGVQIWSPEYHDVDNILVDEAHSLGLKVIPYTVNKIEHVEHMVKIGIDGIITDYPVKVSSYGQGDKT